MAKSKKSQSSIPNKNIHLRLSFLHEAATYLAKVHESRVKGNANEDSSGGTDAPTPSSAQPRHLINHMKGVGRKSVIRLSKDVKRSVCKGCDQLLISEQTTSTTIENRSKNQLKLWANVRVVGCRSCGTSKRLPVGTDMKKNGGGKRPIEQSKDAKVLSNGKIGA